jgi:tetratricopeptide (TPR) repeat protein
MADQKDAGLERMGEEFLEFVHEEALRLDPEDQEALARLAESYSRSGRHEEGLALDRRLIALRPEDPVAHYNLACSLSRTYHEDEAVVELRRAVELGYADFDHMERDDDLENVRKHPGWSALLRESGRA